jgi:hypothetical protein
MRLFLLGNNLVAFKLVDDNKLKDRRCLKIINLDVYREAAQGIVFFVFMMI